MYIKMTKKELLETIKLKAIAVCAIRYANGRMDYYLQKSNEINGAKEPATIIYRFDGENNKMLRGLLNEKEREILAEYFNPMERVG